MCTQKRALAVVHSDGKTAAERGTAVLSPPPTHMEMEMGEVAAPAEAHPKDGSDGREESATRSAS